MNLYVINAHILLNNLDNLSETIFKKSRTTRQGLFFVDDMPNLLQGKNFLVLKAPEKGKFNTCCGECAAPCYNLTTYAAAFIA